MRTVDMGIAWLRKSWPCRALCPSYHGRHSVLESPPSSRACPPFLAVASWVAMRTYATILILLLTVPALAVDTLQVTAPDPVLSWDGC